MFDPLIVQGYHALCVAILANCMPELAFAKLNNPKQKYNPREYREIDRNIWAEMRAKGIAYKEIAELYCITVGAVSNHLKQKEVKTCGGQ